MKIGLDIDDVLVQTLSAVNYFYNRTQGTSLKLSDYTSYDWWEIWHCTRAQSVDIFDEFNKTKEATRIKLVPGAKSALEKLSNEHDVVLITSRPKSIEFQTQELLHYHFPKLPLRTIFSADFHRGEHGKKKYEIAQAERVRLMVEDSAVYGLDCARVGIKTILFPGPYHNGVQHPLVTNVSGWTEALNRIQKLTKNP